MSSPRPQWLVALLALACAGSIHAQTAPDPTGYASSADIARQVAALDRTMKPGQSFAWQPLLRDGTRVAAIEIWKRAGKPAVHPDEAEYAIVLDGAGTLISGGTLADAKTARADLIEGERIVGGTTRPLARGDVVLIPAGVPHGFGITGKRLVLLGTKMTVR